jgi:hypothetical protein
MFIAWVWLGLWEPTQKESVLVLDSGCFKLIKTFFKIPHQVHLLNLKKSYYIAFVMQRLIETLAFVSILFTFHILYTHLGQPFNLSLNLQLFSEGSFNFFPTKLSILFCFLTSFLAQMVYQQNSKIFASHSKFNHSPLDIVNIFR